MGGAVIVEISHQPSALSIQPGFFPLTAESAEHAETGNSKRSPQRSPEPWARHRHHCDHQAHTATAKPAFALSAFR